MLDALVQDSRYAVRWLTRAPGFALVAILSLGLGIGFNAAIFSLVDALLLRPLPVAEPDRLVDIYTSGTDGDTYATNSLPDLTDFKAGSPVFDDVAGYTPMFAAIATGDGRARLTLGEVVTGSYFQVLGVGARLGRTILPSDDAPDAAPVAAVSSRYWKRALGGRADVVGQVLRVKGERFTIVGVIDDRFTGMLPMLAPEVWVPVRQHSHIEPAGIISSVPSPTGTSRLDRRGSRWLFAKARLKPGVSADEARAHLQVVAARLAAEYPQTNRDRVVSMRAAGATRIHPEADGLVTWMVTGTMIAVGLVLLIACANVAGMLLARASARQREISIRLAIGAGRGHIVRQLLTESVVLGACGALVGLGLAWWFTTGLSRLNLPLPVAVAFDLRLDPRVLAFTAAIALATGILAGLAPALRAARTDITTDLKGDLQARRVGGRRWNARDLLVVGQVAVTSLLLVVAALLLRSLVLAQHADVGFRAEGLAVISTDPEMAGYEGDRAVSLWRDAERRVAALPGVERLAFATRVPFSLNFHTSNVAIPGRQRDAEELGASFLSAEVSPEYFATIGVDLVEGRLLEPADTVEGRPRVAVVSETLQRRIWPDRSAVGQVVHERTLAGPPIQVVGVVADHRMQTVGEAPQAAIFFPLPDREAGYRTMIVRTRGDVDGLVTDIERTLLALDPNLVLIETQTMRGLVSATLFPVRATATLLTAFGGLGLLLAALGLYGVIAYSVARRTREIGIRMAIGARPGAVLGQVMRQGMQLTLAGIVLGAVGAALVTRVIAGSLYGVTAADPLAWSLAALLLLAVTAMANLVPARRAMRIDPVTALRTE